MKSRLVPGFALLSACVFLAATTASAATVTVGCSGGQPGQFTSIAAAVNSLDVVGPHTIFISGTCTESLFIGDHDSLTLASASGQPAILNAAHPGDIVLQLADAHRFHLNNLVFQGGSIGLLLGFGSEVYIQDCTFQNNSAIGIDTQQNSDVFIQNSSMKNNGQQGLSLEQGSNVTLSTYPTQHIEISGNGSGGISVDAGFLQENFGTVTIENNGGPAIFTRGGRLLIFGGPGSLIQNNSSGVIITQGTSAWLFGNNVLRNNGPVGLQVDGASVLVNGTPDGMDIEGHSTFGVKILGSAEVTFDGAHKIQANGSASWTSGINLSGGSLFLANGVQILNNTGTGVSSDFNGHVQTDGSLSVSGNSAGGIRLQHMSIGNITAPFKSSQPIACDRSSLVFGNLTGLNVHCGD